MRVETTVLARAITEERVRLADDLHDTVGSTFAAIAMLARGRAADVATHASDRALWNQVADLADGGKRRIGDAVHDLTFAPDCRRGLEPAARNLAARIATDARIEIKVEVRGAARRLPAAIERALFRVVHEALTNAWRHSRCSQVGVSLDFSEAGVSITVADDGRGLPRSGRPEGVGIASMERAMHSVGGLVRVANGRPCGAVVHAWTPSSLA